MPIRVTCACGKKYTFKDEFAGRRAKCPACGQVVVIPGERATAAPRPAPKAAPAGLVIRKPKEVSNALLYGGLGVVAGVVVIGLGIVGYFVFKGATPVRPRDLPPAAVPVAAMETPAATPAESNPPASPPPTEAKPPAPPAAAAPAAIEAHPPSLAPPPAASSGAPAQGETMAVESPLSKPMSQQAYKVEEQQLGPVHEHPWLERTSKDDCHWAYIANKAGKELSNNNDKQGEDFIECKGDKVCVVLDGQAGPEFDGIGCLLFSDDGTHLAYTVRTGAKWRMVVDGKPGIELEWVDTRNALFSPDGKRLAYLAGANPYNKHFVVVDEQPGLTYETINQRTLCFSPDGKHVAYEASLAQGDRVVVVDGKAGPEHGGTVESLIFSPDGKRIAYVAYDKKGGQTVVVDGQTGPAYDQVGSLAFSPDGKRLAYVAHKAEKDFLVIDGQPGPAYEGVGAPVFSPDGSQVTYSVTQGKKSFVVVNGQPGPEYDGAAFLTFSPDGRRFAYVAVSGGDHEVRVVPIEDAMPLSPFVGFGAQGKGGIAQVVLDGQAGPKFGTVGNIGNLVFSPDGRHLAYRAEQGGVWAEVGSRIAYQEKEKWGKWCVVVDQKPGQAFEYVGNPVFSPDGKHVAYLAKKEKSYVMVVDNQPGPECAAVASEPVFGPNSSSVAFFTATYIAQNDRGWRVLINGGFGPKFDKIISWKPAIHQDGVLEYLAVKDKALYRVKHIPVGK